MSSHVLARLPPYVSRWVGYRSRTPSKLPFIIAKYVIAFWSFVGAFGSMSVLQAMFTHAETFKERHVPAIVGSFAASAILCYGAIESPLAQPRAVVGGHFIAALIGVCTYKLFALSPRIDDLRWVAASLACALALLAMAATATTHPPAGATALLASTEEGIVAIGWYYIAVVLLSSVIVVCIALFVNNIQRRYPMFWFAPAISIPAPVEEELGAPDAPDGSQTPDQRSKVPADQIV